MEYRGSDFSGWQRQDGPASVQESLERALREIAQCAVPTTVAGRTDAGVHALGQVVHFDAPVTRPALAWTRGVNRYLPSSISVLWARPVPRDFHARFAAVGRRYRYCILNRSERSALYAGRAAWVPRPLAVEPMQEAASLLLGRHDFSAFRAAACQAKHPIRELRQLRVSRQGDWVFVDAEANAFLHHMVRNLVGVLLGIGWGDRPPHWAAEVLASRKRALAGVTAPAEGLYFVAALYPPAFALPTLDFHQLHTLFPPSC
ncbi:MULTISPECIES: tRNA pseudouridine(38-40) synthase TruA [Acidithiobacillus]|uniref:tRNA pseudouridine synthase A n=1 Tax=Acidithiobacillus caldus TaxID=33059 RepID=A0A1E7YQY5_9PROT|nr:MULTISPECIES: tRNA pseudouridine(38-40) synthase TruA [Acidithiobacillus]AUW33235.1 tRNA pseudouridine(38-40) synthase TruA [Acidithiobacillus caldus]MBU2729981.1 tRNA pseudouridine(38-40) synthase TruA [Acidithiobacillus caldus]MBU2736593.1 tRNA pseudouridine(38-40) synthase TruA [Acidithiobacillus caldus ATCC 51756]MBU2744072.1 tRNA pseudouridine(38-40) synthase TruA [Acidithiobacillus caldus]MBU2781351.1 tRNA pseudouridine(38-40) synthase TruA [Acidithiobacillus caldus]